MALNEGNKKTEAVFREERVLEFWRANKIFSKTLSASKGKKEFIFYEGPPTANGKPGIHHLEARAFKDAIPRYKTMRGYHVRRKGGWDTHGLPVELQVEKKLGLNSKKAIEEYGIAKFNEECKKSVWEYVDLWEKFTERIGYWLDQENPYVTYKNDYIESVWNVIKKADEQKLLYKDYKVVPWCPRCETALSSHELAQGYEDVKDLSITAKFKIIGFPDAYFLAWTTTPWTLPGNIALAVGEEIEYVEIKIKKENKDEILVLAKDRLSIVTDPYEIVATHKGKEMVGMQYEPLFPYLKEQLEKKGESTLKAFKVYAADFVNTEDGTGIVHTAVMYGQDDFELGTKVGLPKHHLVNPDGTFIKGTGFLEGRFVREEKDGKPTMAVDIIRDLQERNLFFSKENYLHSYPHCWRCKTALIYYARDSWYIRMSDKKIKEKLINENKKINWEPEYTREGRFGEWLKDIKDWAISRERYWGTPLPVWLASDGDKIVVDSLDTLKKYTKKSSNKYFVLRHGESEKNLQGISNSNDKNPSPLTPRGEERIKKAAKLIKNKKIDYIFVSPLLRTQQSAKIVASGLEIKDEQIITDQRLREIETGEFDGKSVTEYCNFFSNIEDRFTKAPNGGETLLQVKKRMGDFIYEIDKKFTEKNILIISHEDSIWMLECAVAGLTGKEGFYSPPNESIKMGELRALDFSPIPHNEDYERDFHRPYIDQIVLKKGDKEFYRTKEVMDVWLDSGAMPFAQDHYPFENKKWVEGKGYPADYISEAIDQTRGWFYTLHAVGILMGRGRAFKNVICLGHLLDANGKKMSKSLGNIVDPWEMIEKYGVDTLRLWMYSVNQPGESKNFDEKTVQLLSQQVFGLLYNVLAFYELYPAPEQARYGASRDKMKSKHVLDKWILAKLDELIETSIKNLENYKLLEPTRAIRDFIGDLSTWYLRRSRERIKEEVANPAKEDGARQTLYFVLKTLAKIMAPFAPFAAEDIWIKLREAGDKESVHLSDWPKSKRVDRKVIEEMQLARNLVSEALMARQEVKIQVRQPLQKLKVQDVRLKNKKQLLELITDEINVKEIVFNEKMTTGFELETIITPELKQEGNYRELVRAIQDMRKKQGLTPSDVVTLSISTNEEGQKLIQQFESELKKVLLASKIELKENDGGEIKISELLFKVKISK